MMTKNVKKVNRFGKAIKNKSKLMWKICTKQIVRKHISSTNKYDDKNVKKVNSFGKAIKKKSILMWKIWCKTICTKQIERKHLSSTNKYNDKKCKKKSIDLEKL